MKLYLIVSSAFLALLAFGVQAKEVSLGKFTLAPGEKKSIHIAADKQVKVGYTTELAMDKMKSCKKMGIRMHVVGNPFLDAQSPVGTEFTLDPKAGKVDTDVELENQEAFPIPLEVTRD